MNRFWSLVIEPCLAAVGAKVLAEVGVDKGENSVKLIQYSRENSGFVHLIDPSPAIDVEKEFEEDKEFFSFHKDLSLNVIWKLRGCDAYLLDGDHNWYTVFHELKMIRDTEPVFPLIFFHDISWPYDRRDLYYSPSDIPPEFQQPYRKSGINISTNELTETDGFNASFNNSVCYGIARCGVLTAVEDFVREGGDNYRFIMLPVMNGLGVLFDSNRTYSEAFYALIDAMSGNRVLQQLAPLADKQFAAEHVRLLEYRRSSERYRAEADEVTAEKEHLRQELSVVKNEAENLRSSLVGTEEEREALRNALSSAEKEKEQLNYEQESLENELLIVKNDLERIRAFAIAEEKRANKTAEELSIKEGQIDALQIRRSQLEKVVEERSAEILRMRQDNRTLQRRVQREEKIHTIGNQMLKDSLLKGNLKHAIAFAKEYSFKSAYANWRGEKLLVDSELFDSLAYLLENPDVCDSGMSPLTHYVWYGGFEGRPAGEHFDSQQYLLLNPDVEKAHLNPLVHYALFGKEEKRKCPGLKRNDNTAPSFAEPVAVLEQKRVPTSDTIRLSGKTPTVSIIMPTWNRRNVISRAIDSVFSQSFQSFELIVIDDGSTDGTVGYLSDKYNEQISAGALIIIKANKGGVCHARNIGLENASGELIAYLDSDNEWFPNYLKEMTAAFSDPKVESAFANISVENTVTGEKKVRNLAYIRKAMLDWNRIDLNVFMHRRLLYQQFGGFDLNLRRLVDWDLILRYTRRTPPYHMGKTLAKYYISTDLKNITTTENLEENRARILKKNRRERSYFGLESVHVAYVLWDYPAASQTFVFNEIRFLMDHGCEVTVFYKITAQNAREPDFPLESYMVSDADDLAQKLVIHDIDYMHSHFAYPVVTLLVNPAAKKTGIPYSFAAHAVDIFLHINDKRNHVGEIAADPLCEGVFVSGEFHFRFLTQRGVPKNKIIQANQVINPYFEEVYSPSRKIERRGRRIIAIGRYVEKKGFEYLIKAAEYLPPEDEIVIYGYGPLKETYESLIEKCSGGAKINLGGEIVGFRNEADILLRADLLVAPSVVAANGDIDGFPTVLYEAMAAGVPCISTSVSSIPYIIQDGENGFIVEPEDSEALAEKIKYVCELPVQELERVIRNAHETAASACKGASMGGRLLKLIFEETLDIFMVTYCADDDISATKNVIDNLFEKTVSRFCLTIVDNNSSKTMKDYLKRTAAEHSNIRLVLMDQNLMCGGGSNVALDLMQGDYAIYLCSNEAFPLKYGWEQDLVEYMDLNPNCAMAGQLVSSPKFYNAQTYLENDWCKSFRNLEKLKKHQGELKFVQGGAYILRMSAYKKVGGFSEILNQSHMDVEYSWYLQSNGYSLGNIPGVLSNTKATRPEPSSFTDEQTVVIHPFDKDRNSSFENAIANELNHCCVCGSYSTFVDGVCPECNSSAKDRYLYRYLAETTLIYRGIPCSIDHYRTECEMLKKTLSKMFRITTQNAELAIVSDPDAAREFMSKMRVLAVLTADDWSRFAADAASVSSAYSKMGNYQSVRILDLPGQDQK